jgi:hypothetical protein
VAREDWGNNGKESVIWLIGLAVVLVLFGPAKITLLLGLKTVPHNLMIIIGDHSRRHPLAQSAYMACTISIAA